MEETSHTKCKGTICALVMDAGEPRRRMANQRRPRNKGVAQALVDT